LTFKSRFLIAQNRSIAEPVKDNQAETTELRKKLENYQKDKVSMHKLQKRFDAQRKQLDNLKMELDAKILHSEKITEERDELKQKFEEAILDVQQKSSELLLLLLLFTGHFDFILYFPSFRSEECNA
jgi:hypothetical protein